MWSQLYGVCYYLSNSCAIVFRHIRRFNYQTQPRRRSSVPASFVRPVAFVRPGVDRPGSVRHPRRRSSAPAAFVLRSGVRPTPAAFVRPGGARPVRPARDPSRLEVAQKIHVDDVLILLFSIEWPRCKNCTP